MSLTLFLHIFVPVLVLMLSVGPVSITLINISMLNGYKQALLDAVATFLANAIYITFGALMVKNKVDIAQYFDAMFPRPAIIVLSVIGASLLISLAYDFWRKKISTTGYGVRFKFNMNIVVKMFCLTLSSPVAIVGYAFIFTSIVKEINSSLCGALFSGYLGVIAGKLIIISVFHFLGKKCNIRILNIINKISAILLFGYAIGIIATIVKNFI